MSKIIDLLKDLDETLNEDYDHFALIGRAALNHQMFPNEDSHFFQTLDFDLMCPNYQSAEACREILEQRGFIKNGGTFISPDGEEIDIMLADADMNEGVIGGYCNLPSLAELWPTVSHYNGIPSPELDDMMCHRILYSRDNGRDIETVQLYMAIEEHALDYLLEKIQKRPIEEQEKCLFTLYEAAKDYPDEQKRCEQLIMNHIIEMQNSEVQVNNPTYEYGGL